MRLRIIGALLGASVLVLTGCDNKPSGVPMPPPAPAPAPQAATTPVPAPAPARAETPAAPSVAPAPTGPLPLGTSQAVYTVDSLVVSHPDDAPQAVIIRAMGSVRTGGWTEPTLEEMPDTGDASVKSYRFVATSPTAEATVQQLTTVEADVRVESLPLKVSTIRIVSETNEISASVEQ